MAHAVTSSSSQVVLPPLQPSPGPAGSKEAVVKKDLNLHTQQQITYGNDGSTVVASPQLQDWLDRSADASSIPMWGEEDDDGDDDGLFVPPHQDSPRDPKFDDNDHDGGFSPLGAVGSLIEAVA
ncbi:hypothetical protein PG984_011071 [Apiospora sp. TS-2023a]